MTTLEEYRGEVAGVLDGLTVDLAGGAKTLKALDYMSENVDAPVFVVVPGQPYIATSGEDLPFGMTRVSWLVVVLVNREASKSAAAALDRLLSAAWEALNELPYDVVSASQPGTLTYNGLKFFGSVITMQHDLKL